MARIRVQDRRAALVEAAVRVMTRGGVAAATTRAVVGEAGMSLASFHYAFTSRDEMLVQATHQLAVAHRSPIADLDGLPRDPGAAWEAALVRCLEEMLAEPGHTAMMVELAVAPMRIRVLEASATELVTARRAVFVELAQQWADRSAMTWRAPVETVASLVLAALDGVVLQWLVDRDTAAARVRITHVAGALRELADPPVTAS